LPDFIGSKSNVKFKCSCGTISIKCLKSLTNEKLGSFCTKCNHKNAILKKKKASDIQEKELKCIKCKETKPIDLFLYESTTWKKEISEKCNDCRAKKRKTDQDYVKRKKEEVVLNKETHKKCTGPCNNILLYSEFTGNNKTCNTCGITRRKQFASRKESAALAKTLHPDSQLCIGCYYLYPPEDFITDQKQKHGDYCKVCRERNFERKDIVAEKLLELKGKCVDCGETNIKLLEFDHINPEEKRCNVGNCRSVKALEEEIAKCEVRCIICHLRRTKKQFFYKENTLKPGHIFIDKCKRKIGKCELCLWFDPDLLEALQFDHLDQSTKLNTVSRLASLSKDIEIIKEEIAKCRLICAHCHKLHTIEQLGYLMYSGDRREGRKEKIKTI